MKFRAPFQSPAHLSILDAAEKMGHDRSALRRLLWLVNAHPDLVAHAQVFANILAMLESPACQPEQLEWAGRWTKDIPAWRALCSWMARARGTLATLPGLDEFDRQPRHERDNPLVRQGVGRHGVVACLWNRHEHALSYPPAGNTWDGAARYFALQTQVFLTYVESRHRLSELEAYEHYAEPDESPTAPAPTTALGLAVREFSHARYGALLTQFPDSTTPVDYARALITGEFVIDESLSPIMCDSADALVVDTARYLETVRRYFRRFTLVMGGWIPPQQRRKRTHGSSGGHGWRSGFVHFDPTNRIGVAGRGPKPDDPDLPYQQGDKVCVDLGAEDDGSYSAYSEIERLENLEEIFQLYDPDEVKGQLHQMRLQNLALDSRAQQFAFDFVRPTREELSDLHLHLEQVIEEYLHGDPKNIQKARSRARAALILKVMLILGQSLEHARQLRFATISARQLLRGELPAVDVPTLLLVAQDGSDVGCAPVAGFCMPAIGPDYKLPSEDEPEDVDRAEGAIRLEDINRPLVDAFILPDALGVGRQLHAFLRKQERPNTYVFGVEPDAARSSVLQLVQETGHDRLSPEKIRLVLPGILADQGYDQTIAWMLTNDTSQASEPRMFYTRHSVANLQHAYARAVRRLARHLGTRSKPVDLSDPTGSENAPSVGARFVIRLDDLKGLVSGLKGQLKDHRRMPLELLGIRRYHDAYLFFTWLMQSLHTSVRPTSRPNGLYSCWNEATEARPWVGLSEKDSRYSGKARPVRLTPLLEAQFAHYGQHFRALANRLGLSYTLKAQAREDLPLFVVAGGGKIEVLRPGWIEAQLRSRFAPLPANFHRAFLRTELLERGCSPEAVDGFMGHANVGEAPFSRYATFDYGLFWPSIEHALRSIHEELGLEAIPSRLVPFPARFCHA